MSGPLDIMRALRLYGPMNARELADETCDSSGSVARYMAKLLARGAAVRIDGQRGRGTKAIYALTEQHP